MRARILPGLRTLAYFKSPTTTPSLTVATSATGVGEGTVYLTLQTSAGAPATGLTHATSGLVVAVARPGAADTALTLGTQTPTGAWVDSGFCEVSATNAPGVYRLDLPATYVTRGATQVIVAVTGTGLAQHVVLYQLRDTLQLTGTAVTGTLTASAFTATGLGLSAGQANRRLVQFIDGPAAGERALVVAYDGSIVQVAPPLTAAPVNGNRFALL